MEPDEPQAIPEVGEQQATSRRRRRFVPFVPFVPIRLRPALPNPQPGPRQRLAQFAAISAVCICLIGAWGVVRDPFGESAVRPGQLISSAVGVEADSGQGPAEVSSAQSASALPSDFQLWSLTSAGSRTLYALGSASCGDERCPTLAKSADDGKGWRRVHTFAHTDTSAADIAAQPAIQPPGALSDVMFVNPRVGYVFGGDAWVTTDGGASFAHLAHQGSTVLDMAVQGKTVDVLTADGCVQGNCSGQLSLARMPLGSRAPLPEPLASVTPASSVSSASLVSLGSAALVLAQGTPGSAGNTPGAWRVAGTSFTTLSLKDLCHGNAVLSATERASVVTAVCDATPTASTTTYSTLVSTDGGLSWALKGAGNLSLPTEGRVDLASSDASHLVASTGGPRMAADGTNRAVSSTALAISADGGRTWHTPASMPPGMSGGFDAVVATGSRTILAIPRGNAAPWRSTDDGRSWHPANMRGSGD